MLEIGFTVVKRPHDHSAVARVWTYDRQGCQLTLQRWDWPNGRPTAEILRDVHAAITDAVSTQVVLSCGVQGVLIE